MNKKQTLLYLGFALTTILSLLPFFQVGFTTADDFQYFNTARTSWRNWMSDARIYAEGAGRFYFLITKIFYYVPYLVDNFAYTKAVQYLSLIACYCMFAYLIYRIFHLRNLSLITLLLLIFNTTLTPNNHIPTIAYPFYFTFSIILFIGALLLYLNYIERGGYWRVIVSALLFLIAYLFYETYLIFALIFGVIIIVRHCRNSGLKKLWYSKAFWNETWPYMLTAIIYIGCYWGYRQWLLATVSESFYDGASFSWHSFSLEGFFNVLKRCTRQALPAQNYFENQWLLVENSQLIGGHRNNLWRVLTHAPAIVWVNAILQAALLWVLTRDSALGKLTWRKCLVGIGVGIVVAFSAHTLIGIATKYNLEWSHWMHGYVTTIYSLLALMMVLALMIACALKLCRNSNWSIGLRLFFCVIMVLFSVLIGYTNHHISREWSRSQHRMDIIDLIGQSGFFNTLPDDAVLYTEELHNTSWVAYDISKQAPDIEYYINLRSGRNFQYVTDTNELEMVSSSQPLYYIHAIETKKACELLVSISLLDSTRSSHLEDLTASDAEVFYYSPCKKYIVFYQSANQWRAIPYGAEKNNLRLTHVSLSDSAINPRTIVISNMIMP